MASREELFARLESSSSYLRLQAARGLREVITSDDRSRLVAAQRRETDAYVTAALSAIIAELGTATVQIVASGDGDALSEEQAQRKGELDALRQFLHEISPLYGLIEVSAQAEIGNYAESRTCQQLRRMRSYIDALKDLSKAQEAPPSSDFDLAECVIQESHAVQAELNWPVGTVGPAPLIASGRPSLIALIAANALRNAVESEKEVREDSTIVATWGETDSDYWVSVIDRGVGIPTGMGKVFEKGTSLKRSHMGMGLAIAARAARSMNGRLSLEPNAHGGATLQLRWLRVAEAEA